MPPPEEDLDCYDDAIRAELMTAVVERYAREGSLTVEQQAQQGAETYFIIHPVLKHMAVAIKNGQPREQHVG